MKGTLPKFYSTTTCTTVYSSLCGEPWKACYQGKWYSPVLSLCGWVTRRGEEFRWSVLEEGPKVFRKQRDWMKEVGKRMRRLVATHQTCGWECNFTEMGTTRRPGASERRNGGVSKSPGVFQLSLNALLSTKSSPNSLSFPELIPWKTYPLKSRTIIRSLPFRFIEFIKFSNWVYRSSNFTNIFKFLYVSGTLPQTLHTLSHFLCSAIREVVPIFIFILQRRCEAQREILSLNLNMVQWLQLSGMSWSYCLRPLFMSVLSVLSNSTFCNIFYICTIQ